MKSNPNSKLFRISAIIVSLGLVLFIAGRVPWQLDLTEDGRYTLSDASRRIVTSLEEPMTLRLYFSRSLDELPSWVKNYATTVEDLLAQFESSSRGLLRVEILDPKPDTELEEQALRSGISGHALQTGNNFFFGLQAIQADQTETIPMFNQDRERFLEYDIAELIHRTRQVEKPVLGILTSLPLFGTPANPMMGPAPSAEPWLVIDQLRRSFEVEEITEDQIGENISVLAVVHPTELSDAQLFAIDQFALSGKPFVAVVDPSGFVGRQQSGNPMMGGGQQVSQSNLETLFSQWGIEFDSDVVVGDGTGARQVPWGPNQSPITYPYFFAARGFNSDLSVVSTLREVWLLEPGSVGLSEGSSLTFTPLVVTSDAAGEEIATRFGGFGLSGATSAAEDFEAAGGSRTLAGIFEGQLTTAFPEGAPASDDDEAAPGEGDDGSEEEDESAGLLSDGSGTIVVIADSDFIADQLLGEQVRFLGSRSLAVYNDNLAFVTNLMDHLAGNPDLLTLRGKGTLRRPFDVVEAIRRDAEARYKDEVNALQAELEQVQQRIRELNTESREQGRLVASAEAREAVEQFRKQEADVRSQIRQIRKKTRESIEALQVRLAALNVLLMPTLVVIGGVAFFRTRSSRS